MPRSYHRRGQPALQCGAAGLLGVLLAVSAPAQSLAEPADPAVDVPVQDELDFQGRSSVVQGSGARALGMGGAFLARADDATAASWNPAGLSYLRTPEFTVVGTRNAFDTIKDAQLGGRILDDSFLGYAPDLLAVALPFELGSVRGAGQLSFQRTFSHFAGKRSLVRNDTEFRLEGSRGFDVLALGTGIQISRGWRLGMTVNRWVDGFEQERERLERRRTVQKVAFDLSAWNVNLGLIWTPIESLNVGFVGKTPFSGRVRLSRARQDIDSETEEVTLNAYSSDDVRLDFPGAIGLGISWRPRNTLTLAADYTRSFWSSGEVHNYFVLPPAGPDGEPASPQPPDDLFDTLPYPSLADSQVDTEQLRFGAEYVLIRGRLKWPLRAGLFTDRQYFEVDGQVPTFLGFTLGTGVTVGPMLIDVAYMHEWGRYNASDAVHRVVYTDVSVDRVFFSVIYRHGRR